MDPSKISNERIVLLKALIQYLQIKLDKDESVQLNFICTHNSRRSHFAQIWAQTMADYFNLKGVHCYSGGTEATAIYPTVVESLTKQGFAVKRLTGNENPFFAVKFAENAHPVVAFSKVYDAFFNPKSAFAAIMTCSQADEACPFVAGAEERFSIPFDDPKVFDGTIQEIEKYKEKSLQIAGEMFYVFSKLKKR